MKVLKVEVKTTADSNVEIIKALEEVLNHIRKGNYEGEVNTFDTQFKYSINDKATRRSKTRS